MPLVCLDNLVGRDIAGKAADAANDKTQEDNANEFKDKQEPSTAIRSWEDVSKADG